MKTLSLKTIVYIAVAICTLVIVLTVTIWASLGNTGDTLKIVEGEIVFTEKLRSEYFVQEPVDTQGVELHAGKNVYSGSELTFTVDNESAGEKMVEVSHTEDGNYYRAYFPVTYFSIRHFAINRQPQGFLYDDAGNVSGLIGLELWAELSGEPHELPRPLEHHEYSTVVELSEDYYDFTVAEDEYGGILATVSCAGKKVEFYFIDINGTMTALNGSDRVLSFKNENENGAKLTLFVTQINGSNGADGWYIYERADGTKEFFRFAYHLEGWASFFESNKYDGRIYEQQVGDDYIAIIEDTTFFAAQKEWNRAILGS